MGIQAGVLFNTSIHITRLLGTKKGQATYIAPLRPATLASFLTWGSSPGAGRVRLALRSAKVQLDHGFANQPPALNITFVVARGK